LPETFRAHPKTSHASVHAADTLVRTGAEDDADELRAVAPRLRRRFEGVLSDGTLASTSPAIAAISRHNCTSPKSELAFIQSISSFMSVVSSARDIRSLELMS
jgi:hypothetical protein